MFMFGKWYLCVIIPYREVGCVRAGMFVFKSGACVRACVRACMFLLMRWGADLGHEVELGLPLLQRLLKGFLVRRETHGLWCWCGGHVGGGSRGVLRRRCTSHAVAAMEEWADKARNEWPAVVGMLGATMAKVLMVFTQYTRRGGGGW